MATAPAPTPRHNLGLFRLAGFVGRTAELDRILAWLGEPDTGAVVISGPAGAGKTSLATATAWAARDQLPGGMIWVGAAGRERFRREDIFHELDSVVGSAIMIQPPRLRLAAAIQILLAEPRLLVLDELDRVAEPERPEILDLVRRLAQGDLGSTLLIAETIPDAWQPLLGERRLTPEPLDATAVEAMAESDVVPGDCAAALAGRWDELVAWTGGNPLRCRLALGLAGGPGTTADADSDIAAHLAPLAGAGLDVWIEAAAAALRRRHPAAALLLERLSLASGGVDRTALTQHYGRDLGPSDALEAMVTTLVHGGLVASGRSRVFLHPAVREHVCGHAEGQLQPQPQPPQRADWELGLADYYLALAQEYGRQPRENWSEIDADWPNIRRFAHVTVDRFEQSLGHPLPDLVRREALPEAPAELAAAVEAFAMALLPIILWRHPHASRRWLTAGQIAARSLDHAHIAAQLEAALGGLCYLEDDAEEAVRHFRAARAAFDELGDLHRLMQTELELGAVLRALERHEEAIQTYRDAVALAEEAGDEIDRATAYAQLGAAFYAAGESFRAIEWLDRARPALTSAGGPALTALLNNLGLAYEAVGRYREAIEVYERSFGLIEPATRASQQQMSTIAGNIGAAFYELGDVEASLSWYRRDLALSQAMGDQAATAATHHNIGHVLLEMSVPQGALAEFKRAREIYARLALDDMVAEEDDAIAYARLAAEQEAAESGEAGEAGGAAA